MVNHKELSQKVSALYSVPDYLDYNGHDYYYITQDIDTMMRLAVEHDIEVLNDAAYRGKVCRFYRSGAFITTYEDYVNTSSKVEATCVAIAKALIKLKSE